MLIKIRFYVLIIIFTICMFSSTGINAQEIEYRDGFFKYILDDSNYTASISSNLRIDDDLVIPSSVVYEDHDYKVTSIGDEGFMGGHMFSSVIMPDTIEKLGEYTFAYNYYLTSVKLSKNLSEIPDGAFAGTNLAEIEIPQGVISIGNSAFFSNELIDISFPDSVKKIGNHSFSNNKITNLNLPDTITSIGEFSFNHNPLERIKFSYSMKIIPEEAFSDGDIKVLIVPKNIEKISSRAFYGNRITELYILNIDTVIESNALSNYALKSVYIEKKSDIEKTMASFDTHNTLASNCEHDINFYALDDVKGNYIDGIKTEYNLKQAESKILTVDDLGYSAITKFDYLNNKFVDPDNEIIDIDITTIDWYKVGTSLTKSNDIKVGAGRSFTLENAKIADRGEYYALVNDLYKLPSIKINVKVNTSVKVNYLDEAGKSISESTVINGLSGDTYTTSSINIDGYILKKTPNNNNGVYLDAQTNVNYIYQKNNNNNKEVKENNSKLPKTGESTNLIYIILGLTMLMRIKIKYKY